MRALGGTWDTRRAVTALRDAGHGDGDQRQQEKRTCRALRDLAATGVIATGVADSDICRLAER
ncbi:hypothetical protein F0344_25675 [Streptomyces finlayi]|uniref:Uncharacterized protein n=1 Tax=Streptomyces finlayi TaxID=67296 RepID=A0A7G7BVR9_9ACTN|nr:hypothetical protein F0344_25675 [Streptomyces finlayi]